MFSLTCKFHTSKRMHWKGWEICRIITYSMENEWFIFSYFCDIFCRYFPTLISFLIVMNVWEKYIMINAQYTLLLRYCYYYYYFISLMNAVYFDIRTQTTHNLLCDVIFLTHHPFWIHNYEKLLPSPHSTSLLLLRNSTVFFSGAAEIFQEKKIPNSTLVNGENVNNNGCFWY